MTVIYVVSALVGAAVVWFGLISLAARGIGAGMSKPYPKPPERTLSADEVADLKAWYAMPSPERQS